MSLMKSVKQRNRGRKTTNRSESSQTFKLKSGGNRYEVQTGSTGNGASHNNLQPYLVLNYIIKT